MQAATKRFELALFIIHPTLGSADMSVNLGLVAKQQHSVGEPRHTPAGAELPGVYPDTRWRYVETHETTTQHFVLKLTRFVDRLSPHKAYLSELFSTGGSGQIIVSFLGGGHFGDTIPPSAMAAMSELGLGLGLEVYTVRQN